MVEEGSAGKEEGRVCVLQIRTFSWRICKAGETDDGDVCKTM